MKTVKIKFVGKYAEDLQPKDNAITYYLQKNFDYPEKPLKYKHIRRISD